MIENRKQLDVTVSQMEMLKTAVAHYDIELVTRTVGSRELAMLELRALNAQVEELANQIEEFKKSHSVEDEPF